jgi:hypothetical protein
MEYHKVTINNIKDFAGKHSISGYSKYRKKLALFVFVRDVYNKEKRLNKGILKLPNEVIENHIFSFLSDTMAFTSTDITMNSLRKHLSLNRYYSLEYYKGKIKIPENLKVRGLDLSDCKWIEDVSTLSDVHTICLSYCWGITDVSALGSVHTLDLSYCWDITDVSALGRVHTLNLSCCTGITDVSALGSVHTLDLGYCSGITDVSALGGVHTLCLFGCDTITDVSALGGVHTLDLEGCTGITDVSALGSVHTLYI